ncbi:MAG: hypothetical protein OHK93_004981 [Ramalina farinacea]|uniref:protein-ribulosamine 3-kinase n=1 Tax=Ramalina farinacea TaxID=258253 RepID=A0AA43QYE8_9LECA|nr:hypothetical protein [Ramalina farinacea]
MNYHGAPGLELGEGNVKLDPSVLKVLPNDCRVVSTETHGVSFWANTGRIDVNLSNGQPHSFFIKVISTEIGRQMMCSEYECMKAIHMTSPDFVPKPVAWGTYETIPDTHFFLCDFRDMIDEMPDPYQFSSRLAAMHQDSKSPDGKFGFHVETFMGNLPQLAGWEDKWQSYFTKSLRLALQLENKAKGDDPEFDHLLPILFDKVIPRLLDPLESNGRTVKPSLVHGDLWFANAGIDADSQFPLIFDACSFYAHNECKFGAEYEQAYHSFAQISPPEEDYDGRVDLYKLRFNTHVSALFADNQTLREQYESQPPMQST